MPSRRALVRLDSASIEDNESIEGGTGVDKAVPKAPRLLRGACRDLAIAGRVRFEHHEMTGICAPAFRAVLFSQ